MKTIALVNQKGGCGKTTSAVNLAGALAGRGERVLLVDLDPQAHATMALSVAVESQAGRVHEGREARAPGRIAAGGGREPRDERELREGSRRSIADVLLRGDSLREALHAAPGGVVLVPSTLELSEFEEAAGRMLTPERLLRQALGEVAQDFDFALLDCPPRADGVLTANALRAADVVVLVIEMGAFALQGAFKALAIFEELAAGLEARFDLRVLGTLFDRKSELARELLIGTQARFGSRLFDTVVHQSSRLREAAASGVPVQVLDPACRAARDFEALAEEICLLDAAANLQTS